MSTLTKTFRRGAAVFAVAATFAAMPGGAAAQTWLHDSFEDDAVGAPPNGPEIGSVVAACTAGTSCGNYTVVRIGGQNMLHVNGEDGGLGLQWFLAAAGTGAGRIGALFTPLPGGSVVASNAFNLEVQFNPFGTNALLSLGDEDTTGLRLHYGITQPGDTTFSSQLLPLVLLRGQQFDVQWDFDTALDKLTLSIDGAPLAQTTFAGGGIDSVFATSAVSNFATTTSWLIDEVYAQAVPEPASAVLLLCGGLALAGALLRKSRSCRARRSMQADA